MGKFVNMETRRGAGAEQVVVDTRDEVHSSFCEPDVPSLCNSRLNMPRTDLTIFIPTSQRRMAKMQSASSAEHLRLWRR